MSLLIIIFCCFTVFNISEGKNVQGIIGRNVSFSWTFKNVRNDDVYILHNESRFREVLPLKTPRARALPERMRVLITYTTPDNINVTVDIFNITEKDAGKYRVVRHWKFQDLDDNIYLKTTDETILPKIAIVGYNSLNSSIALECRLSNLSAVELFWMVNGSLIGKEDRYSQNNTFLSIRDLTVDDQYNLYKCKESGSGLESDQYRIKIAGPNAIEFAPSITMVQEYSGFNLSCLADCSPICSWKWTKLDLSMAQEKVISTQDALHIQNITRQDSGNYSCEVLNKITNQSIEVITPLQIEYGPDEILFNSSDKIIHLDENDSITISCSADCFPPCQIDWSETNADILIPGAELMLVNVNRSCNYTCLATSERKDKATITDTIYVIMKSGTKHYTTTVMTSQEDAKGTKHYSTTGKTSQEDAEEFPSKRHLLYILLGTGIIIAVALLACLLHKIRFCLRVDRVSTSNTFIDSKKGDADESVQEDIQSSCYWTIVDNAEGEVCSAIETEFGQRIEEHLIKQSEVSFKTESNQPVSVDDFNDNSELDGYLNPIHSHPVDIVDYIHPVNSGPVNSGFVPKRHSTAF